ncbi:MAG TPA: phosphate ABC transporter substrate-binding protein PstS [Candidatus Baltobacteraceae bacterium]|nr:phosphate ABC transporter substrate-binding protein PstS [Candidatus Baltobacteraceae bacterium]
MFSKDRSTRVFSLLSVAVLCGLLWSIAGAAQLAETGSTLLLPLMNTWVDAYRQHDPSTQITTEGSGSGAGIARAIAGDVQIGASDAYMSDAQMKATPMLNIPLAISAQQVDYNVPEIGPAHLNLSGPVLAAIYSGTVEFWDDAQIAGLNAVVAKKLPHARIIPVKRAEGSGDTFIFTQYLSETTPSWKNGPGFGTKITWPAVASVIVATGNPGMVAICQSTKYSLAYIGISFLTQTNAAGLGYAALRNRDGKFVLPSPESIGAAVSATVERTPRDARISLIDAPGAASYPIINYEYAIVKPQQADKAVAADLKKFLDWTIAPDGGQRQDYLSGVHFVPLPSSIVNISRAQIARIE